MNQHPTPRNPIRTAMCCLGNTAVRVILGLLTAAAVLLTGTAAHAGTNPGHGALPPGGGVHGTNLPTGATVVGGKPVTTPKAKVHAKVKALHITALPRTGGLYTAGLEGGAGLVLVGGALIAAGRRPRQVGHRAT